MRKTRNDLLHSSRKKCTLPPLQKLNGIAISIHIVKAHRHIPTREVNARLMPPLKIAIVSAKIEVIIGR